MTSDSAPGRGLTALPTAADPTSSSTADRLSGPALLSRLPRQQSSLSQQPEPFDPAQTKYFCCWGLCHSKVRDRD